ncbi:superoxide dismutase family protein [Sphingomonas jatrophae]|uniref:Superoxide dismutase [Cu-Zn] n=1 Tax=Sphingomonas jatrophae TaxID=1166337 RepID=A0A1I6L5R2_9SPHN|nr:superoxide dismutase family protein [Sphingomonas jatrophae]SFR98815.1 superoxide dismutase, Cu-Zn family [Sphingomonas jatrophae]
MRALALLLLAGGLAGCAANGGSSAGASTAERPVAMADLADASGAARGTARLFQADGGLRLVYDGTGLPASVHGIHIHTTGRCDAPDFTTAGGHWNPTQRKHGTESPEGPHGGDMPNLTAAADGTTSFTSMLTGATVPGMLDADGAALLVHATADDYRTDPSGNSGARIACGVIRAS